MRYLLVFCFFFIAGCSGSLNNSGIFWCKEEALQEQNQLKQQVTAEQRNLHDNAAREEKLHKERLQLQNDITAIEREIKITQSEIQEIKSGRSDRGLVLSNLEEKIKKLKVELQWLKEHEENDIRLYNVNQIN